MAIHRLIRFSSILILCAHLTGQVLPVSMNHQATTLMDYEIITGRLPLEVYTRQPYTYSTVYSVAPNPDLPRGERQLLRRYRTEFQLRSNPGLSLLNVHATDQTTSQPLEPHLLTYTDSLLALFVEWREQESYSGITHRFLGHDQIRLAGRLGPRLSIFSQFSLHRLSGPDPLPSSLSAYRNQSVRYHQEINHHIWYQAQGSLVYSGDYVELSANQLPLVWGPGHSTSPLLSGTAAPFPYFQLSIPYGAIRLDYIHGFLGATDGNTLHTVREKYPKYLAGQRFQWRVNPHTVLAFSEMVVYGRRPPEGAYGIPVTLFWAQEHNLGDRDNLLMSLDITHRTTRHALWYASLLWDELQWLNIFKPWWGNKFVFQAGWEKALMVRQYPMILYSEITLSRPWTYTHKDSINTYAHLNRPLGFPWGPSALYLVMGIRGWVSERHFVHLGVGYVLKGTGQGTDVTDNYQTRDPALDENTPLILGTKKEGILARWTGKVTLNPCWEFQYTIASDGLRNENSASASMVFSW